MSERYWITGVQLGLLQELQGHKEKKALVDKIIDKQFIGSSEDLKKILRDLDE